MTGRRGNVPTVPSARHICAQGRLRRTPGVGLRGEGYGDGYAAVTAPYAPSYTPGYVPGHAREARAADGSRRYAVAAAAALPAARPEKMHPPRNVPSSDR